MNKSRRDKLLVVDDEPEILVALGDLLDEEYEVIATASPVEALEILRREPDIAVVVSDQRMPGITGDALLATASEFSDAEALLLTGYADLEAVVRAVNRGAIAGYSPKPWEPAALRSMIAAARDRWRLSRALETERRLLHGLLDNSPDALSFKDREGRFVRLNEAKARALGASVEECLGRRESEFLPSLEAATLARIERAVLADGVPAAETEERPGEAGLSRWFDVNRIPIRDASGAEYLVTIERDVTEARQLEAKLRQADKMQALGSLAGGVAHDFNNLLTAILGGLRIAASGGIDPARRDRLLRNALAAAERGAGLTQRLLSFARRQPLASQPTDPNRLIEGMEDLLKRSLGGMMSVRMELAPDLWPALVDPEQLELALLNLCINARDAMPGGGTVTIATRNVVVTEEAAAEVAPGDYVAMTVCDTGDGIPPEVLKRVFEPFFTTKEIGKGTGLGLSMVYGLAQQSGGTVTVSSTPGQGTSVEILVPRSEQQPAQPKEGAEGPPRTTCPIRILVVDDDPHVREVTCALLKQLGHHVLEASDAPTALGLLERDARLELMVTDLAMPQVNGMELARRAREVRPDVQVLLVTGYADAGERPPDFPVIRKPFGPEALADSIADLTAAEKKRRRAG